jgi:hypothetical protein
VTAQPADEPKSRDSTDAGDDEGVPPDAPLVEGRDYYFDPDGLWVMTARYLRRRGYCCGSGCRHCPYGNAPKA